MDADRLLACNVTNYVEPPDSRKHLRWMFLIQGEVSQATGALFRKWQLNMLDENNVRKYHNLSRHMEH